MSQLIDRGEHRHLNVKQQDAWGLKEDRQGTGYATLILNMNPYNAPPVGGGRLYLNGISLDKLEELRDAITRFLEHQRPKLEAEQRHMAELFPDH